MIAINLLSLRGLNITVWLLVSCSTRLKKAKTLNLAAAMCYMVVRETLYDQRQFFPSDIHIRLSKKSDNIIIQNKHRNLYFSLSFQRTWLWLQFFPLNFQRQILM